MILMKASVFMLMMILIHLSDMPLLHDRLAKTKTKEESGPQTHTNRISADFLYGLANALEA